MNGSGTALRFSTYLGGSGGEAAVGIAGGKRGSAAVTGGTDSTNFPVTSGVVQPTLAGQDDAFIATLTGQ